jgi:YVTN family beta-propeller protein
LFSFKTGIYFLKRVFRYMLLTGVMLWLLLAVSITAADATVIATLQFEYYVSGVAVNPITNRVYISGSYGVTVVDGVLNTVVTEIPLDGAYNLAVNPATNRIYVTTTSNNIVSVIDGTSNTILTNIPVSDYPYDVAVNPATNRVYVTNLQGGTVTVIDGATNTVLTTIAIGEEPAGVAVNPVTNRIYVANSTEFDGSVAVIDGTSNTVLTIIPLSEPGDIAVNPVTNRIYVTEFSESFVEIDGMSNTVVAEAFSLPSQIAVNPDTNRIYTAENRSVRVYDGSDITQFGTQIYSGNDPSGIAVNPNISRIYVTDIGFRTLTVIEDGPNVLGQPPECSNATPSVSLIWPPTNKMVPVNILNVTDPDNDLAAITITAIRQDEVPRPEVDGAGIGTSTAFVRAERDIPGNGRVYIIVFKATDTQGYSCTGYVQVGVPHDQHSIPYNDGDVYDSTLI